MGTGMGSWLKRNYDRIMAAGVLLVLLVSLILLAVQVNVQKDEQQSFDQQLSALTPRFKKAPPADKTVFKSALTSFAAPFQTEAWALSLMTPELRVKCINCERPIPYAATNCTFTMCGAAQPQEVTVIVDRNHNGIPDEWEEKSGVFAFDTEAINTDPDSDGFTSREEYEWKTDPKNPDSHPPYLAKVKVAEIKPIPFRMVFKGVSKANGVLIFQINLRTRGKTYWKKIGEEAEGFKLLSYDEHAAEGPTLTLGHNGKQIPLIKGHLVPRDDYEIKLHSLIDDSNIQVRPDVDFEYKGSVYRVKKVDTQGKRVLINDPSRTMDVWIERQTSEAQPEPKM
jgi:hypothetical protein